MSLENFALLPHHLPTVVIKGDTYCGGYRIRAGTLGKLESEDANSATVLFYAPDVGDPEKQGGLFGEPNFVTTRMGFSTFNRVRAATAADLFIKDSLLRHPSIYQSRDDVLCHAFFVLGNGIEWQKDGALDVDAYDRRRRGPAEMCYEPIDFESYKQSMARSVGGMEDDLLREMFKSALPRNMEVNEQRLRRVLFMDYYCTTLSDYNISQHKHYERADRIMGYVSSNYLPLSAIPANAKRSFMMAAVEIIDKVMISTPQDPRYRKSRDRPAGEMPSWLRMMANNAKVDEPNVEEQEKHPAAMKDALRYLEDMRIQLKRRIIQGGWPMYEKASKAFKDVGFKEHSHSSNGTGSVTIFTPRQLSADDLALIERRLRGKMFTRDGYRWTNDDWSVKIELFPEGNKYRAQIMYISHPEDKQELIDAMVRVYDDSWRNHCEAKEKSKLPPPVVETKVWIEFKAGEKITDHVSAVGRSIRGGYGAGNCSPDSVAFWSMSRKPSAQTNWTLVELTVTSYSGSMFDVARSVEEITNDPEGSGEVFGNPYSWKTY